MLDPRGISYEVDPQGISYEVDKPCRSGLDSIQKGQLHDNEEASEQEVPTHEKPETHESSVLPENWWSPLEYLIGTFYNKGTGEEKPQTALKVISKQYTEDNKVHVAAEKSNQTKLSRIDSTDIAVRILEEELRRRTEGSSTNDSECNSSPALPRHSDQKKNEKWASDSDTLPSTSSSSAEGEDEYHGRCVASKNQDCKRFWNSAVKRMDDFIVVVLAAIAKLAAKNPYLCITATIIVSCAMLTVGLMTNFHVVLENQYLWPPHRSFSVNEANWLYDETKFDYEYRYVDMVIHANGANVLSQEGVSRVFGAIDLVRNMGDYQDGCSWAKLMGNSYQVGECQIHSVADFWNQSKTLFNQEIHNDNEVLSAMSASTYPSGERVDLTQIIGNAKMDSNGNLTSAQSFLITFDLPWSDQTSTFELEALDKLFKLQDQWVAEPNNPFRVEVAAFRSYEDEFLRSIVDDLPLLPGVFAVMLSFCCLVFWRKHKVHSRTLLGMGAVVCIVLSIMTTHGLLFLCDIPFTINTTMVPFLMFGIGLDDAFIILGSYNRTSGNDILQRIETTMHDIGLSIFITTATSTLAFALGCFSNIPAVEWLCLYAFPSVVIDFIYQITFFIALMVLDERRIQSKSMDCCFCVRVKDEFIDEEVPERTETGREILEEAPCSEEHWSDCFMGWYADKLLLPSTKKTIMATFVVLLAGSTYSASQLRQYFNLNDLVPHDSYLRKYYNSLKTYAKSSDGLASYAYFRDMNQSDPDVQQQMIQFTEDLADQGAIAWPPINFWVKDFQQFTEERSSLKNQTFSKQIGAFLSIPLYHKLYHDHIVRNDTTGDIVDSRCEIYIDIDLSDSRGGIDELHRLRDVARSEPINVGLDGPEWKMFTYQDQYHLWEFYAVVISELTRNTIMGVAAVSVIALLLMPHWTAVFFITPLIICVYVDMLGKWCSHIREFGLSIYHW